MNCRNVKRIGVLLPVMAFVAFFLSARADVPWKFEGSTNRVAASESASPTPCADFCATELGWSLTETPWENLVRSIWTSDMSDPAILPVSLGFLLMIR